MDNSNRSKLGLIIGLIVGGVIAVIGVVIAIILLTQVDYGGSYRIAKDLKDKVYDLYSSWDCVNAQDDVKTSWLETKTYDGYIVGCKEDTGGMNDLITRLGESEAIKRDSELSELYNTFKSSVDTVLPQSDDLTSRLDLYQIWHNFEVSEHGISETSTDAEIQTAAKILVNSGNEALKEYGISWREKALAMAKASRDYDAVSYSDGNKSNLGVIKRQARAEYQDYIKTNEPDIMSLVPLDFSKVDEIYRAYENLYDKICEKYAEHYDDSGDCSELLDEVICY